MSRVRLGPGTSRMALLAAVCALLAGCARRQEFHEISQSEQNLVKIGRAYMMALSKLKHPPRNAADLLPILREMGESESCLHSPEDGQEYVILWNVNAKDLSPSGSSDQRRFPVLAYEQSGSGGSRFVLMMPGRVQSMTDDELRNAYFPSGHKPPF